MARLLITGISGCVGHYLYDELLADPAHELLVVVRDPARLRFRVDPARVTVIRCDATELSAYGHLAAEVDHVIYLAAAWGEPVSYETNLRVPLALFERTDPGRIRRILNVSTASILDARGELLSAAGAMGTDYIRSKYLASLHTSQHPRADRIVTVYPTLIFGGDAHHPTSHLTGGLREVPRVLRALRHCRLDGSLHFIHARDLARVMVRLLDAPAVPPRVVVGNPVLSVSELLSQLCEIWGLRYTGALDLDPVVGALLKLFNRRTNSWDDFSLRHRHFRYPAVGPADFGLPTELATLAGIVREAGIA